MKGSPVTANTAGIESTANITSVSSIVMSARKSGVARLRPNSTAKNLFPWRRGVAGRCRRKNAMMRPSFSPSFSSRAAAVRSPV